MTFRPPLKNSHLFGEEAKRSKYSAVNHVMHTVSTRANLALSLGTLSACALSLELVADFSCSAGRVFRVRAMVDRTMKRMETTATTCEQEDEVSGGSDARSETLAACDCNRSNDQHSRDCM